MSMDAGCCSISARLPTWHAHGICKLQGTLLSFVTSALKSPHLNLSHWWAGPHQDSQQMTQPCAPSRHRWIPTIVSTATMICFATCLWNVIVATRSRERTGAAHRHLCNIVALSKDLESLRERELIHNCQSV